MKDLHALVLVLGIVMGLAVGGLLGYTSGVEVVLRQCTHANAYTDGKTTIICAPKESLEKPKSIRMKEKV